jgi:hypothetical protein
LAPAGFNFVFQYLPAWGNSMVGVAMFVFSIFLFITIFRHQRHEQITSGIFVIIQTFTVAGVYLLLDDFASRGQGAGFFLSGMITTLTTYGVFVNISSREAGAVTRQVESARPEKSITHTSESETNPSLLKEEIASITRNLNAEKHRTTQLTYLNELPAVGNRA